LKQNEDRHIQKLRSVHAIEATCLPQNSNAAHRGGIIIVYILTKKRKYFFLTQFQPPSPL